MIRLGLVVPAFAAVPLAFALMGCSGGTTASTPQAAGIGASGGALSMDDGTAIEVPAHALKSTEEITIEEASVPSSLSSSVLTPVGAAYAFGPDAVTFASPVTVTVAIDAKALAGLGDMMSDVEIFWTTPGEEGFNATAATVKDATHVTMQTTHLGTFVAGVPAAEPLQCGPAPSAK